MLSIYQRMLFGFMQASNIAGLLDTVALFYYNDTLGVSTAFLGISSVIVGCLTAYLTGNCRAMHDIWANLLFITVSSILFLCSPRWKPLRSSQGQISEEAIHPHFRTHVCCRSVLQDRGLDHKKCGWVLLRLLLSSADDGVVGFPNRSGCMGAGAREN